MGTSWMFLYEASCEIGVSMATLAYYCGPVVVMILSPLVFTEKITRAKCFGFLAVIIGMICVNGAALLTGRVSWGLFCGVKQGGSLSGIQDNLIPILILGIVNTGIGCYFYFSSIGNLSGQSVAICGYL